MVHGGNEQPSQGRWIGRRLAARAIAVPERNAGGRAITALRRGSGGIRTADFDDPGVTLAEPVCPSADLDSIVVTRDERAPVRAWAAWIYVAARGGCRAGLDVRLKVVLVARV